MIAIGLNRLIQGARLGRSRWMLLGLSSLFILKSVVNPMIATVDPWHGHIVIGGTSSADRAHALLDHRHSYQSSREWQARPSSPAGLSITTEATVLSLAEREMVSSLLDYDNYLALIPVFTVVLLLPAFLLPLNRESLLGAALIRPKPPYPPPRPSSP